LLNRCWFNFRRPRASQKGTGSMRVGLGGKGTKPHQRPPVGLIPFSALDAWVGEAKKGIKFFPVTGGQRAGLKSHGATR
jgi:hypothetical protein